MNELQTILLKFNGISEIDVNEDLVSFKCCDELSLTSITALIEYQIQGFELQIHVDSTTYMSLWYWVVPKNINDPQWDKLLIGLEKELFENLPKMQKMLYPTDGLGTPDLELVTIDQIIQELEKRNINFIFSWINENEEDIICRLSAYPRQTKDLFKFIKKSVKNRKD